MSQPRRVGAGSPRCSGTSCRTRPATSGTPTPRTTAGTATAGFAPRCRRTTAEALSDAGTPCSPSLTAGEQVSDLGQQLDVGRGAGLVGREVLLLRLRVGHDDEEID